MISLLSEPPEEKENEAIEYFRYSLKLRRMLAPDSIVMNLVS